MAEFYDPCAKRRWCLSCYDKVGEHALGISLHAAMVSFYFVLHVSIGQLVLSNRVTRTFFFCSAVLWFYRLLTYDYLIITSFNLTAPDSSPFRLPVEFRMLVLCSNFLFVYLFIYFYSFANVVLSGIIMAV